MNPNYEYEFRNLIFGSVVEFTGIHVSGPQMSDTKFCRFGLCSKSMQVSPSIPLHWVTMRLCISMFIVKLNFGSHEVNDVNSS